MPPHTSSDTHIFMETIRYIHVWLATPKIIKTTSAKGKAPLTLVPEVSIK